MAEQIISDRTERAPGSFDGTELIHILPTSEGVSYKSAVGTAASKDVTTSPTDTTAGRVTRVGDFGIGAVDGPSVSESEAEAELFPIGIYEAIDGSFPELGALLNLPRSSSRKLQLLAHGGFSNPSMADLKILIRGIGDTASGWATLHHTGNAPSDSAWTTVTSLDNGWTGTVRYIKRLGWIVGTGSADASSKTGDVLLTLPSDYRSDEEYYDTADDNGTSRGVTVTTGGAITIPATSASVSFGFAYPVL